MNNESKTEIREYLLGRIADAPTLENIEERLFSDDEFCSQVEVAEEELVHDYVFGKLSPADRRSFDEKIAGNSELRFKAEMAAALKEKARHETAAEMKPGFLESIRAFLQTPAYVGAFAVLLIAVVGVSWFVLRTPGNDQLAELKNIYQKERAVEPRISGFDYAPVGSITRGAVTPDSSVSNRLLLLKTKLLEAVISSPTAKNHHALGVFYLTQKEFAEAIKELDKAVGLDDNARFHNDLGSAYLASAENTPDKNIGDLSRANEEFTRACDLDPNFLDALFNRSLTLQKLQTLPGRAKESWNLYLQKDPSSKWADEAREHLAELEKQQSAIKKIDDILPDLRAAYRDRDHDDLTFWNIHSETKSTFSNFSSAGQLTNAYLKARQDRDDGQAKELIEILKYVGELEKEKNADFFYAELAALYAKADDTNIARLLEAKEAWAAGYRMVFDRKANQSIEQFEKSKELFKQLNDAPEALVAELWTAQILADIDKIDESGTRLAALIKSSKEKKYKVLLPTAYYWVGIGQARQEKLSQSTRNIQEAIRTAEKIDAFYEIRHSSEVLTTNYNSLGEPEKALNYYGKMVDKNYPDAFQTRRNLVAFAETFGKLGLDSTAADFALESIYIGRNNNSSSKTNLTNGSLQELINALANKKQFEQALKYADESNQIALNGKQSPENFVTIADTYLSRADLKKEMENCGGALMDYDRSLEFYNKVPRTTYNLYKVHKGKLLCFQGPDRQSEFSIEMETVSRLSEQYRKNIREDDSRQAFFDSQQDVFDAATTNFLRQNDSRKAFDQAETSKARSLLDFVKSEKPLAEVEKEFASVAKPLSLPEIQARLPENLQLIQYAVLPEKLAIWTLTNDRFKYSEKIITDDQLEKKTSDYLKAVRSKASAADLNPAARELYDLLLPPDIESGKTICLIPDKFLHQVPFASLVSGAGKFLIEDFPIFYSPSASVMVLASENARQKERVKEEHLLGVGNPHFDHEENPGLADLPQAEAEIAAIEKNYPGSLNFTGDKATKENFLSNFANAEVIHFAGHFVANDRLPGYSKLLFSGDPLRSFELAEYRLPKAKLVVLSACETGFERYNRSEGAISIARTFLAAGAPLVLASNWMVDSEATRDLMIAFHRNRKEKGVNSTESLRGAQLQLLQNPATAAPYYWSAFNPVGGFTNY